ncbi:MAG: hypothetical protein ACRD0P_39050 [Stackebrandtia sp.]
MSTITTVAILWLAAWTPIAVGGLWLAVRTRTDHQDSADTIAYRDAADGALELFRRPRPGETVGPPPIEHTELSDADRAAWSAIERDLTGPGWTNPQT